MMQEKWHKGNIPFVRFLIAYVLGILVAFFVRPTSTYLSLGYAVCAVLLLAITLSRYRKKWNSTKIGLHGLLVFLFLILVGMLLVWRVRPTVNAMHFSHHASEQLVGYIRSEAIAKNGRLRFDLEVTGVLEQGKWTPVEGRLLVNVSADEAVKSDWGYGEMLVLLQDYRMVEYPRNPYEFDYRKYLSNRQIYHQAFLRADQVLHMGSNKGNPIVGLALQWRQRLMEKYRFYIKSEMAFNVLSALVLGYRADIEEDLYQAFSTTGTIHVLSVSGMHVGMVYWLLSFLLGWMRGSMWIKWLKCTIIIFSIWTYCVLTGLSPSTLRASVMISFVVVAQSFSRQHQALNAIAASAFFLLLFNPYFLVDVGFQLSYLAVLGMAWLYTVFNHWMPTRNWLLRQVRDACSISVSAQLFATPLSMYYFHLFPSYFLLGNLFIGLPATLIVYGGILVHFLPYGKVAEALSFIVEQLIVFTMDGLLFLAKLPFSSISGVWLSAWQTFLWYALLVFILLAFFYRQRMAFFAALISLLILFAEQMYRYFESYGNRQLVLHQVGKNWAVTYAVGANVWSLSNLEGPSNKQFRYSVLPFLQRFHHVEYQFVQDDQKSCLLRFGDLRLVILEKGVSLDTVLHEGDFVLLRHDAMAELSSISAYLKDITLIVDASNKTETLEAARQLAMRHQWRLYPLKDNYAYVSSIKPVFRRQMSDR